MRVKASTPILRAGVVAVALVLSGCTSLTPSLSQMSVSHNESLDRIERNTLLMNVLRAAERMPMNFTVLSNVSATGSLAHGLSGGLSGNWTLGQGGVSSPYSVNLNMLPRADFTFYLNPLDNEQFMRGFLAGIPQEKLLFLSQGTSVSKALLWTLVTSRAANERVDGRREVFANVPKAQEWPNFQKVVASALRWGVAMELVREETPVGPRISRTEALMQLPSVINAWNGQSFGGAAAGSPPARPMIVELGGSDPSRTHQLVMASQRARFCFEPDDLSQWAHSSEMLCQYSGAQDRLARLAPRAPAPRVSPGEVLYWRDVTIRSPREVFQFVGEVVRSQLDNPAQVWRVGDPQQPGAAAPKALFTVSCGASSSGGDAVLAEAIYRGQICQVPRGDNSHSAEVMQLLSLLVTLSKVQGALPTSPTLLIK